MKNILLLFAFFLTFNCNSQIVNYPIMVEDSLGSKLILMTLEQAQILDNKSELLELYREAATKLVSMDSIFTIILIDKNEIIAQKKIQIDNLSNLSLNKDSQIVNLKERIDEYKLNKDLLKQELENKDKEIELHVDEVSRLKKRSLFSNIVNGAVIAALVILLVI